MNPVGESLMFCRFSFIAVNLIDLTNKTARTSLVKLRYVLMRWYFHDLLKLKMTNQPIIYLYNFFVTIVSQNITNYDFTCRIETKLSKVKSFCLYKFNVFEKLLLIRINLISNFNLIKKIKQNKTNHTKYGNQNGGIKLAHLNKSSSNILKKITLIRNLIEKESPHILNLSESNVNLLKAEEVHPIDGYYFEHKILLFNNKMASKIRNSIGIIKQLNYEQMFNLESHLNSCIWLKIKPKNSKPFLLMGGYRQWSLPKDLGFNDSKNIKYQIERMQTILNSIEQAKALKLDIVILMDSNIDTSENNNHNNRFNIKKLYDMWSGFLSDNNLVILNTELTRFASHQDPSTIDHIISNCPTKLGPIRTIKNNISDHCMLTTIYKSKGFKTEPKFKIIRNFQNVTHENLRDLILDNQNLEHIFEIKDPNIISTTIQTELNNILDTLAPPKRIQTKRNYNPFLSQTLKDEIKYNLSLLTKAIQNNTPENWRYYKAQKNFTDEKLMKLALLLMGAADSVQQGL